MAGCNGVGEDGHLGKVMIYFRSETFGVRCSNGLLEIREFHKYTTCQAANQEADACLEKLHGSENVSLTSNKAAEFQKSSQSILRLAH